MRRPMSTRKLILLALACGLALLAAYEEMAGKPLRFDAAAGLSLAASFAVLLWMVWAHWQRDRAVREAPLPD